MQTLIFSPSGCLYKRTELTQTEASIIERLQIEISALKKEISELEELNKKIWEELRATEVENDILKRTVEEMLEEIQVRQTGVL